MFGFAKKIFVSEMMFFSCNVLNVNSLECVSVTNQECKVRPEIINIKSDPTCVFHHKQVDYEIFYPTSF